jgi:type VI secretion system protein ImpG
MDELLPYYERELAFLRRYSRDFAEKYPKIASRLAMSTDASEDPHVERMIESFALLGARIHRKLDDDYPEFTDALLEVMYPHYLRPFPSCSIAQFNVGGSDSQLTTPVTIKRGTELNTRAVKGVTCKFRTSSDVQLSPLKITRAEFNGAVQAPSSARLQSGVTGSISIELNCPSEQINFSNIKLNKLRIYIDADPSLVASVRDCLFMHVSQVFIESSKRGVWQELPATPISEVSFSDDESLIDFPARSHPAYRLLTEYFAFPDKFNFFDLDISQLTQFTGSSQQLSLHFLLKNVRADSDLARLLEPLATANFKLNCSPVVNLFKQRGDPIRLTHAAVSYPVVADARRAYAYDVYSIDSVNLVRQSAQGESIVEFKPFYALRHGQSPKEAGHYWFARRNELVAQSSPGYETEISIVDIDLNPTQDQTDTLSIGLTCTNRDLPASLSFGLVGGDMFLEGGSVAKTISLLRKPTAEMRFARGRSAQWRLISHLSLNHMSLLQSGLPALKEMLRLYDLNRTAVSGRQIDGIVGLEHKPTTAWLPGNPFAAFVRGIEVQLTIDDSNFVGTGLTAFTSVMDRFFALYVHANSFIQLVILSKRTNEELIRCSPRSGDSILA